MLLTIIAINWVIIDFEKIVSEEFIIDVLNFLDLVGLQFNEYHLKVAVEF